MCTTTWGAILRVNDIQGTSIGVSDPNAIDAGMWVSAKEVKCLWKIILYEDAGMPPMYDRKEWARIKSLF